MSILSMKSVRNLSSAPFVSLLVCGFYWTAYGWFKHDYTILIPNAASICSASFCMWVYYEHAIRKPNNLYMVAFSFITFGIVMVVLGNIQVIGVTGCLMSVLVSGSPLAVVNTVILEKSTASLPFWPSFVTWVNTLSWVFYGAFVSHDVMVLVPNAFGLALASIQMCLFCVYGFAPAVGKELSREVESFENPYNV
eukprot:CAMPEP_0174981966 /NCGR_PEP_ID=MMETSP0004_2-20121128/16202_1 /TAXON_ID=420556 /ORGANISM="Ochromonas sp., Strain CCMP1393" /LENGTH=194 /DNA_ID=CAMNT_0016233807 /DNA_START=67 /DNA_END=651 /DNA_ORIENTATION=-